MNDIIPNSISDYAALLVQVRDRIRQSQIRAVFSVNAELIRLYWDIGHMLEGRQEREGYGKAVIPRLARDIQNELPEVKGFSERNIGRMIAFSRAYPKPEALLPQAVASFNSAEIVLPQVGDLVDQDSILWSIPWGHHAVLMEKVKDNDARIWYMRETLSQGWSRAILMVMIKSNAHTRQVKAVNNFTDRLPPPQSDLAVQSLKDPYIFDFLTLEEPFRERELETGLIHHVEKFLLELGQGFAFVGRQYHLELGDEDFYLDLLFYHIRLRCFVVIDLKIGSFKAEYAGKMNFYLNVVDEQLRQKSDAPSIGMILCQDRNGVVAEYALRGMNKPIGVSEYELTRSLPRELQSSLPSIQTLEARLIESSQEPSSTPIQSQRESKTSVLSKWPMVQLGHVLSHRKEFIVIDDLQTYKRCRVQLHAQGVVLRDIVPGTEIKTKKQQVCRANDFLVAEIDAKLGGYGLVPAHLEGAIVSSHYFLYEVDLSILDLSFLDGFIRTSMFGDQVAAQGSTNYAAIRPKDVLSYKMPLPSLNEQRVIVAKLNRIQEAKSLHISAGEELEGLYRSMLRLAFRGDL